MATPMGKRLFTSRPEQSASGFSHFGAQMFASLETHFAKWAESVGSDIAQHVRSFIDFAKGEEARVAAEVEHLKSLGMQVTKDGAPL